MGGLLLDHVEKIFFGSLKNVEDVQHFEIRVVCEGTWIAEAKEGIEGFTVFRHGNNNESILDLLIRVASLCRLRNVKEGLEEWGCEREEELEDTEIDVVRRTQDDIRLGVIERRSGIDRVAGHCPKYLEADVIGRVSGTMEGAHWDDIWRDRQREKVVSTRLNEFVVLYLYGPLICMSVFWFQKHPHGIPDPCIGMRPPKSNGKR